MMENINKVDIRPGVNILSVLKHLNYKPHYALAEFVDNAIDSYLKNEKKLKDIKGDNFNLRVDIEFDIHNARINIKDNAAGIHLNDFPRAFRAAELPPDNTKLSEFGMGMKSAACWFSNRWQVKTKAINDNVERTVSFNISEIVEDKIQELLINTKSANSNSHYTLITLYGIKKKMPVRKGLWKVKRHLASIYREFFRKDILDLYINGEKLVYSAPRILETAYYDTPNGEKITWKKEIDFKFGNPNTGLFTAKGFIGIMEKMSVSESGIALFRRGRVIEGSADNDEGFRPPIILGSLGSHRYKRLFGELHLEGFNVSHTKDAFQWDDNKEVFLETLKKELENDNSMPILKQADNYRVRESSNDYKTISKKVVDNTTTKIQSAISQEINRVAEKLDLIEIEEPSLKEVSNSYHKSFPLNIYDIDYVVHIELSYDETIEELIQVGDHLVPEKVPFKKNIGVRLSLIHPFMVEFAGGDEKIIEPLLRLVVALGLSEIIVKKSGAPIIELRNNMNELLLGSLSKK